MAAQGLPPRAVPADPPPGPGVRDPHPERAGRARYLSLLSRAACQPAGHRQQASHRTSQCPHPGACRSGSSGEGSSSGASIAPPRARPRLNTARPAGHPGAPPVPAGRAHDEHGAARPVPPRDRHRRGVQRLHGHDPPHERHRRQPAPVRGRLAVQVRARPWLFKGLRAPWPHSVACQIRRHVWARSAGPWWPVCATVYSGPSQTDLTYTPYPCSSTSSPTA